MVLANVICHKINHIFSNTKTKKKKTFRPIKIYIGLGCHLQPRPEYKFLVSNQQI